MPPRTDQPCLQTYIRHTKISFILSAAWRSGLERRFYDGHDRKVNGSTPNPASLDKMLYDDYLCLVESGKQQIKEVERKSNRKTWKRQLLSESGFVLRIAPPSLSRDRRIKMKKSIKSSIIYLHSIGCQATRVAYW